MKLLKKNFEYLHESIINLNSFENITSEKSIEFKIKNNFNKDDIIFNMSIFSLCFNFYEIKKDNEMNDKIIKKQKLYLPFKLLSFFYLLDYTKFKNFISEIIIYDKETKSMVFNQDKLREKLKKYIKRITVKILKILLFIKMNLYIIIIMIGLLLMKMMIIMKV